MFVRKKFFFYIASIWLVYTSYECFLSTIIMSMYTTFPCCACKKQDSVMHGFNHAVTNNMCKIGEVNLGLDIILKSMFFYINPDFSDKNFIEKIQVDIKQLTLNETTMILSIIQLLKIMILAYDPSKINMDLIKCLSDVSPYLIKQMNKILEDLNRISESPSDIIAGNTTFQKLVLDILLFTVNYLSQCIHTLNADKVQIFHIIVETVHNFLWQKNIASWIAHSIQVTNPFGKF